MMRTAAASSKRERTMPGVTTPGPLDAAPCRKRRTTRVQMSGARAPTAEATAKAPTDPMKSTRRSMWSASHPQAISPMAAPAT